MNQHRDPNERNRLHALDEVERDRAWLYVADALEPNERRSFEAELDASPALRAELDALRRVGEHLLSSAPSVAPPASLGARLRDRIAEPGPAVSRTAQSDWQPSGFDGVDVRRLFVDFDRSRQTVLVRLRPGAVYPVHAHEGHEECYVIDGDLIDGDLRLAAGDFTCFPCGTTHGPLSSKTGCLLLVQASLDDHVEPGAHPT